MSIQPVRITTTSSRTLRPNPLPRVLLRLVLPAVAITVALAVEMSIVPRLHLPHATPDLLLLVVIGCAAVWGPSGGAATGFAAGLVLDLAPPSVDAIGRHALVLTLVGALAGRVGRAVRTSALRTCLLAGLCAAVAVAGNALLGTALGDGGGLDRPGLAPSIGAAALYTAVATPLVVPGIAALARRTLSPGARVVAPAGDALSQMSPVGVHGAYDGMTFRGMVAPAAARPHAATAGAVHGHSGPLHANPVHPEHAESDHVHAGHPGPDPAHADHPHPDPTHPGHTHPSPAGPSHAHPAHEPRDPAAPDPAPHANRRPHQNPEAG